MLPIVASDCVAAYANFSCWRKGHFAVATPVASFDGASPALLVFNTTSSSYLEGAGGLVTAAAYDLVFSEPPPSSPLDLASYDPVTHVNVPMLGCPGGHQLSSFEAPSEFSCDGCTRSGIPPSGWAAGCRECDYDLCAICERSQLNQDEGGSDAPTRWPEQLKVLGELGVGNTEEQRRALEAADGHVERAIELLLGGAS